MWAHHLEEVERTEDLLAGDEAQVHIGSGPDHLEIGGHGSARGRGGFFPLLAEAAFRKAGPVDLVEQPAGAARVQPLGASGEEPAVVAQLEPAQPRIAAHDVRIQRLQQPSELGVAGVGVEGDSGLDRQVDRRGFGVPAHPVRVEGLPGGLPGVGRAGRGADLGEVDPVVQLGAGAGVDLEIDAGGGFAAGGRGAALLLEQQGPLEGRVAGGGGGDLGAGDQQERQPVQVAAGLPSAARPSRDTAKPRASPSRKARTKSSGKFGVAAR